MLPLCDSPRGCRPGGSAAESCRVSAVRPRGYGRNILHLKWPYFQAVAHPRNAAPQQRVRERRCLKNRAEQRGRSRRDTAWEGTLRPVLHHSHSGTLEVPPAACNLFLFLKQPCAGRMRSPFSGRRLIPKSLTQSQQHTSGLRGGLSAPARPPTHTQKSYLKEKLMKG